MLKKICSCILGLIKKKFFINQKNDLYQECDKVFEFDDGKALDGENQDEEYLVNYVVTTRWQTL